MHRLCSFSRMHDKHDNLFCELGVFAQNAATIDCQMCASCKVQLFQIVPNMVKRVPTARVQLFQIVFLF